MSTQNDRLRARRNAPKCDRTARVIFASAALSGNQSLVTLQAQAFAVRLAVIAVFPLSSLSVDLFSILMVRPRMRCADRSCMFQSRSPWMNFGLKR